MNFFCSVKESFGPDCYQRRDKRKKVRNFLYKYICWQGNYKKVVKKVVQEALEYHNEHCQNLQRPTQDGPCPDHSVLVLGAHLCQKYKISDDHDLIHQVMLGLFTCDHSFDRFMTFLDPLAFPFELDMELYPFHCDVSTGTITPKHLAVLEYFLGVAGALRVKVKFSSFDFTSRNGSYSTRLENVPLVDVPVPSCRGSTPLLLACHSINPESVMLLLRHGADPLRPGQVHHIIGLQFQHPLYVLVTKLNASVFWRSHNHHLDPGVRRQFVSKQEEQDKRLRLCLRYFCRAARSLPIVYSNAVPRGSDYHRLFQIHPFYKGLIPDERTKNPAELTHICRSVIREAVKQSGALPAGIYKLPVPTLLKHYLDLLTD